MFILELSFGTGNSNFFKSHCLSYDKVLLRKQHILLPVKAEQVEQFKNNLVALHPPQRLAVARPWQLHQPSWSAYIPAEPCSR